MERVDYVQALLHANELPAMLVAHHLIALLDAADAAGAITGEIVAEIVDALAEPPAPQRTAIRSTTDGVLYQRRMLRQVRPGQSCGKIAGRQALPSRRGVLLEP